MTDTIIYEQPLNEHLRVCLRLENLFEQAQNFYADESPWSSRMTMRAILDIVNILERPDLKSKFVKALSNRATNLALLEHSPNIDTKKLKDILYQMDQLSDYLHSAPMKLAQSLRDNEFLNSIRLNLSKPGGVSIFSSPAYHWWLQQAGEQRTRDLAHWLKELEPIRDIAEVLLKLTRQSGSFHPKFADQGFYQEALTPTVPYQIIRVALPTNRKVFPEISVGRHRLSIHFLAPNFDGRHVRVNHEIQFKLACCDL